MKGINVPRSLVHSGEAERKDASDASMKTEICVVFSTIENSSKVFDKNFG